MNIVVCRLGNHFSGNADDTWKEFREFFEDKKRHNHNINIIEKRGYYQGNCYYARNLALGASTIRGKYQNPFQDNIKYDYILWIDSDSVYKPKDLLQLIDRNLDIVGGWYKTQGGSINCGIDWDLDHFAKNGYFKPLNEIEIRKKTKPFECTWTGFGFMLVKYGVFETLEYPWFKPVWIDFGDKYPDLEEFTSEDVGFACHARKSEYKIFVDPKVHIGHEKIKIIY